VAQVVEHLPSKHKVLSSNPTTERKEKERKKEEIKPQNRERSLWFQHYTPFFFQEKTLLSRQEGNTVSFTFKYLNSHKAGGIV
jgi:hypothetical protein